MHPPPFRKTHRPSWPTCVIELHCPHCRGGGSVGYLVRVLIERHGVVDDGLSVRFWRDIGGDQVLGRDADRRVGDQGGFELGFALLPEALDPLGQGLQAPAERSIARRFVSAHCVLAGYDAFAEVGAQARHGVGEAAHADADERPLFCPGQLFLTGLHAAESAKLMPGARAALAKL
jgi:hypothetical protein